MTSFRTLPDIFQRLKVPDAKVPPKRPLRDSWIGNRKFRNMFIDKFIADFLETELPGIVSSTITVKRPFLSIYRLTCDSKEHYYDKKIFKNIYSKKSYDNFKLVFNCFFLNKVRNKV